MFNDSVNISNHLTELRERERKKAIYSVYSKRIHRIFNIRIQGKRAHNRRTSNKSSSSDDVNVLAAHAQYKIHAERLV